MTPVTLRKFFCGLLAFGIAVCGASAASTPSDIPHLASGDAATQLMVHGKPFLVLGGELHNSTSSNRAYLAPFWPKLAAAHLNTVLAVVSWDLVEPVEGTYDFTMVDHLIEDAREHDLKLVLLWFGSWKNGLSHYVPDWVKLDRERFPYARTRHGSPEILSVFSDASREADARAYGAFMRHLREVDGDEHTVIMIQVQNEVGLHGDSRDRNRLAEETYAAQVPRELITYLREHRDHLDPSLHALWRSQGFPTEGSWPDVLGRSEAAEEAFMAWHYARYIDEIAAVGKAEYPLPTFVNAWIVQPQDEHPGEYPAGGPQAHVLDLWEAAAPHIDLFSPDIYLPNFQEICELYARPGNPLFVPESRAGPQGMAQAFLAIGRFDAIGYSPFGIERSLDGFDAYESLSQLAPLILQHQGTDRLFAVSLSPQNASETFTMGGYRLKAGLVSHYRPTDLPERGYGLIIATGEDEFLIAGGELQVTFASDNPNETVGIATAEEGVFQDGQWVPGRTLNGDEIMLSYAFDELIAQQQTGTGVKMRGISPQIQKVRLYRYTDTE